MFFFVMKERGCLNYLLIIILSKKHHGIRGALEGGGGFGWRVVEREEKWEGEGGERGGKVVKGGG